MYVYIYMYIYIYITLYILRSSARPGVYLTPSFSKCCKKKRTIQFQSKFSILLKN